MEINKIILLKQKKEENIIKKLLISSNWRLIITSFILSFVGIVMIWSATFSTGSLTFVQKQLIALIIGILLLIIFSIINYQLFQPYFWQLYTFCILLLIFVLIVGTTYRGTRAWIDLKFFTFQPSEIVKIIFILVLAGYFDTKWTKYPKLSEIFIPMGFFTLIFILLILQPDFSAIVVYLPIIFSIFYFVGVDKKMLFYTILFGTLTTGLFITKVYLSLNEYSLMPKILQFFYSSLTGFNLQWLIVIFILILISYFIWWILRKLLFTVTLTSLIITVTVIFISYSLVVVSHKIIKPYQQKRIVAFLNPYFDPSGAGYQVIQTKIAIGSGKILGKGLFNSTQGKLGFVPEKHTDFIFSLLAEEFGFVGSTIVVFLYFILILEGINIMKTARDTYGSIIACGITSMFAFYFLMNLGMCLGLLPVVGLPLPFVSYGGSNLISSYLAIGLLNSIHIRKFMY